MQCPKPCGAGLLAAYTIVLPDIPRTDIPVSRVHPPLDASISAPGEENRFNFEVSERANHEIVTGGLTDTYMYLYGPNTETTQIAEDDDGAGVRFNSKIVATLSPGTYFVKVRHYSKTGTGDYSISIQARQQE